MKKNIIYGLVLAFALGISGTEVFAQNQIPNTSVGQTPKTRTNDKKSAMSTDYSKTDEDSDIADVAASKPEFSTLVDAANDAGVMDQLKEEGPYTLFAPTNRAFEKLSRKKREELLKPENSDKLKEVLNYHVVEGSYSAESLRDGQKLVTVNGDELSVTKNGDKVMINGVKVAISDVKASNGLIHVMDAVVMPEEGSSKKTKSVKEPELEK